MPKAKSMPPLVMLRALLGGSGGTGLRPAVLDPIGADLGTKGSGPRSLDLDVGVAAFAVVVMCLGLKFRGDHDQAAMADASFRDNLVCNCLDLGGLPLQDSGFHAVVVIEMNVEGRQDELVVVVESPYEPLRQVARGMVENIDDCGNAILGTGCVQYRFLQARAGQVADSLRAVLVASCPNDLVKLGHQIVVKGYGDALHIFLQNLTGLTTQQRRSPK